MNPKNLTPLDALRGLFKFWKQEGGFGASHYCPGDGRHNMIQHDCPLCDAFNVIQQVEAHATAEAVLGVAVRSTPYMGNGLTTRCGKPYSTVARCDRHRVHDGPCHGNLFTVFERVRAYQKTVPCKTCRQYARRYNYAAWLDLGRPSLRCQSCLRGVRATVRQR